MAAALGNVDPGRLLAPALHRHDEEREVHQQLADGRDPRQGVPRPGLRARAVGRALQPDAGGQDLPAPVRRTHLPPPRPRRRQDRPGADPDHAGEGPRHGREGLHGDHRDEAPEERGPGRRGAGLHPRVGQLRPLQGQGGRDGDRRLGPHLQGHLQLLGGNRRRRGPLLRRRRRPRGHGDDAVPPDGDGLASRRARPARHRGRARRGRPAQELRGQALHGGLRPGEDGALDARRGRAGQLHRGAGGPRLRARRGLPGHHAPRLRGHHEEAADDVRAVQEPRRHRHLEGADGGLPDRPLHDGRRQGRAGDLRHQRPGPLRRWRGRGRPARREPPRRELALGPARLRAQGRGGRLRLRRGEHALDGDRRSRRSSTRDRARARAAGEAGRTARARTSSSRSSRWP